MRKTTKRVLGTVLALLLGLVLLAPGVAAAGDPNAPVITKQPTAAKDTLLLGQVLRLEAAATLPDGVKGKLSYDWYAYVDWEPGCGEKPLASGAQAGIPVTRELLGDSSALSTTGPFYVVATNTYTDNAGKTREAYTVSEPVYITLFPGYSVLPAVIEDMLTWSVPLSYFLFPVVFLPGLFITVLQETRYYIASLF